jgi:hypothetical protein
MPRRPTGLTKGPFPLDEAAVAAHVPAATAGVFVAGYETRHAGVMVVRCSGRADDLAEALRGLIGGPYTDFKFEPVSDPARAFEMHCLIHHEYEPPGEGHPRPPAGSGCRCPVSGCFERY